MRHLVELSCGGEVAPEWLFDNHARVISQFRSTEAFDHRFEERRGNR